MACHHPPSLREDPPAGSDPHLTDGSAANLHGGEGRGDAAAVAVKTSAPWPENSPASASVARSSRAMSMTSGAPWSCRTDGGLAVVSGMAAELLGAPGRDSLRSHGAGLAAFVAGASWSRTTSDCPSFPRNSSRTCLHARSSPTARRSQGGNCLTSGWSGGPSGLAGLLDRHVAAGILPVPGHSIALRHRGHRRGLHACRLDADTDAALVDRRARHHRHRQQRRHQVQRRAREATATGPPAAPPRRPPAPAAAGRHAHHRRHRRRLDRPLRPRPPRRG